MRKKVQTVCCTRRPSAWDQPLSAFALLTSCSGWPRACIRSVHTRHRHTPPFRPATAARPRAHPRGNTAMSSRTQIQSSVSRPTASAGAGAASVAPAGAAIIVLRGYRHHCVEVPFCCGCASLLPSRQRAPERMWRASSCCPLCITPSPDPPTLKPKGPSKRNK